MTDSNESELIPVRRMEETLARLRDARSVKISNLTRRMNILNNLMMEKDFLDIVKDNMLRLQKILVPLAQLKSLLLPSQWMNLLH